MKILSSYTLCIALTAMLSLGAETEQETVINWTGQKGDALLPPAISSDKGVENMPSTVVTVVENGEWQGMIGTFALPVNLNKYGGIEFYVKQSFYPGNPTCVIRFNAANTNNYIYRNFNCGDGKWTRVVVPFEKDNWSGQVVEFGEVKCIVFYPFKNLNKKGMKLEICGLKFLKK